MTYLNWSALDAIDGEAFRAAKPYPWVNPKGTLTEEGRAALIAAWPDFAQFQQTFGMARNYGQQPHDRWELRYDPSLALPEAWKAFIGELQSERYRDFIRGLYGRGDFDLRFEWHMATRGNSVSPHCDGLWKIGPQLFYMNDPGEWDPAWGGSTLVLDDEGKMDYRTAPAFEDFAHETAAVSLGNYSFLFARGDHAWHGVRPLECPEGKFRRMFAAVVDRRPSFRDRAREWILKRFKKKA